MNISLLSYLICPLCKQETLRAHSFTSKTDEIEEGIILCTSCRQWYLIEERILEMLSPELNLPRRILFYKKHTSQFKRLRLQESSLPSSDHAIQEKIKQSAFFDDFSSHYVLEQQTFWRVYYAQTLQWFQQTLPNHSFILDIGCGNGLGSAPLLSQHTVIGVDISRQMVKDALHRLDAYPSASSTYFVADAEALPFKKNIFDACIGFGILHHIVQPDICVKGISRVLKKGGFYYGHENNKTIFRPLFDLLMKIFTLWSEEAGEHQLLSTEELRLILEQADLQADIHTNIFFPPHLFNLMSYSLAWKLMAASDSFFHHIPWFKHQGGTLVFRAQKR